MGAKGKKDLGPGRHVRIDGRHFIVKFDERGPRMIYERVKYNVGHRYLEGWCNRSFWHRDHDNRQQYVKRRDWALPKRILAALNEGNTDVRQESN